jgi:hypothetical protein
MTMPTITIPGITPPPPTPTILSLMALAKSQSMAAARLNNLTAAKSTYSTLELGARTDGRGWETGCARLGMSARSSIFSLTPTMDELVAFFRTPCEWIYLSGHYFGSVGLLCSKEYGVSDGGIDIQFFADSVEVAVPGERKRRLTKASGDFRLHLGCTLVVLAACSGLRVESCIRTLRTLFDKPVLLGNASSTDAAINNAMMGGGLVASAFFGRVGSKRTQNDPHAARDAWLETAKANFGRGATANIFRAVDADGQMWKLSGGAIVPDAKL